MERSAEERAADLIFGEVEEPASGDEREVEPVVEGEESEEIEASEEDVEDTQDGDEDTQDEDLVEIEFDGQVIEAPKAIADALMRQQDYTQKTQELSAQRKTYEVAAQQVQEMQKAYQFAQEAQSVNLELQQADQLIQQWEQHISQNAKDMDAQTIAQAQLEIKNIERYKAQKEQELSSKQQEFQQAQEQTIQELLNKGTEVLRSRIPGWGEAHINQVKEYGKNLGFTDYELQSVIDPRQVEVLWKAAQYDSLQEGKTAARVKAKNAPVIKSKGKGKPMSEDTKAYLNARKGLKSSDGKVRSNSANAIALQKLQKLGL
jgi:hypothetical protein